jgi:L-amino acid N-acyltransferase YncA
VTASPEPVVLRDGRAVLVREATRADVPRVAALYAGLSATSFGRRFLSARPDDSVLLGLASAGPGTVVLLAEEARPSRSRVPLGEARYTPVGPDLAEFALCVADSEHHRGLGRLLLETLMARAAADGFPRLSASVLVGNEPMLRLLARHGWLLTEPTEGDLATLEVSSTGDLPGWPDRHGVHRVLVESRTWSERPEVAALRAAGHEVRVCQGPSVALGRGCPLVESGACRAADEADEILDLLPQRIPECQAVALARRPPAP